MSTEPSHRHKVFEAWWERNSQAGWARDEAELIWSDGWRAAKYHAAREFVENLYGVLQAGEQEQP